MRILHLTPGTGNFHCGSCLRDLALVRELRNRGHEVTLTPLYLPLVYEDRKSSPEVESAPLQVGGINLYLEEKLRTHRWLPRIFRRWMDQNWLLRGASAGMGMTSPSELGKMTVECMKGVHGNQAASWRELIAWMSGQPRPDVVSLSNGLLLGIAAAIRDRINVPVIATLQGEDTFLDALPDPFRSQAWALASQAAENVTALFPVSHFHREVMANRLGPRAAEKMHVVWNGIDTRPFAPANQMPPQPTIGYLARMCREKGLDQLVDAFLILKTDPEFKDLRLKVAGACTPFDRKFLKEMKEKIAIAGHETAVTWQPNLSLAEKALFLQSLSALSVPATYGESFGLYVLEALASGIPVVQPHCGGFPEILEETGGGLLVAPDDRAALVSGLRTILQRNEKLDHEGAVAVVNEMFSSSAMAQRFEVALLSALENRYAPEGSRYPPPRVVTVSDN